MGIVTVPFFMGSPIGHLDLPAGRVLASELPVGTARDRMSVLYRALADEVSDEAARDRAWPPLVFAGDCVSSIGVLAGLQRAGIEPVLVWFDAHGDFNTWATTPSGFLGGMPLAMIVGRGDLAIVEAVGLKPQAEDRVILVGARDIDPGEDDALAASAVRQLAVESLVDADLPPGPLYVHLDVDVVNPDEMPAQNYPAPGGPSLDAVKAALARLVGTGRIAAVSFSLWNPELPGAARAAAATRELVSVLPVDLTSG
jgi:arginase